MQEDLTVSTDGKTYLEQARECIFLIKVARAAMLREQQKRGITSSPRGNGYIGTSWFSILRSS